MFAFVFWVFFTVKKVPAGQKVIDENVSYKIKFKREILMKIKENQYEFVNKYKNLGTMFPTDDKT